MRSFFKRNCLGLFESLEKAADQISDLIREGREGEAEFLLDECRQTAIYVARAIEDSEGKGIDVVKLLEDYSESALRTSEKIEANSATLGDTDNGLSEIIRKAKDSLQSIPVRYEAVFMPYNPAMWDSLESIWMAADKDPEWEVYVVPIPYYDKNEDGSLGDIHYKPEEYPSYVPITDYREFDLEGHHPDALYIHNPYDQGNRVTTIPSEYYSKNIREQTDCLVYVPYYATSGLMGKGFNLLPAYIFADYIVVQSEEIIDQFDTTVPRRKFLPLGSPKFDRIIRICEERPKVPEEWTNKANGKKVFFYNTSLQGMLLDTDAFLKKLKYVFDTFKEVESACLLWRPHPLMDTTIKAMRAEHYSEYLSLKESFINEDYGIYDATSDVEVSIAFSDAYLGDAGTSIISLFQTVGKPIYVLDNQINGETTIGMEEYKENEVFEIGFGYIYCCRERSGVSLKNIAEGIYEKAPYNYKPEEQKNMATKINASLEGNCGERVHNEIKEMVKGNQ